jgi:hypothetical protein
MWRICSTGASNGKNAISKKLYLYISKSYTEYRTCTVDGAEPGAMD